MILQEVITILKESLTGAPGVQKMVFNPGFTGVKLENGDMGLAMNVRAGTDLNPNIHDFLVEQIGKNGLEVADVLLGKALEEAGGKSRYVLFSLLVALLNALSQPLMREEYLRLSGYEVEVGSEKYPNHLVKGGETVTIVGFGGMVPKIARIAGKTFVTELEPNLFKSTLITREGASYGPSCAQVVPASNADACFQEADTVFITGCTLVTNTMEEILTKCQGRRIIVYGSTAGFFPEPLFKRGVNVLSTRRVTDPELMVDLLLNCGGAVERFFPMASEDMIVMKCKEPE